MSHAIRWEKNLANLAALKKAAESCGPLEMEIQKGLVLGEDGRLYDANGKVYTGKGTMHYRTYKDGNSGRWVGDWPTPEGMTAEETGDNAVAVIRIKNDHESYEIGVVPKGDGTYLLCHDFWGPGRAIEEHVGKTITGPGHTVKEAYGTLVQKYNAVLVGMNCEQQGVDCSYMKREELISYLRSSGMDAEAEAIERLWPGNDGSLFAVVDSTTQGVRVSEGG